MWGERINENGGGSECKYDMFNTLWESL
jgi:hypothetical protein